MSDTAVLHAGKTGSKQSALRDHILGLILGVALTGLGIGQGHAENWMHIPGADECRVDMDSTAYDSQADVVAFRYACPGADVAAVAVGCTSNESWRESSPPPSAPSTNWLADLLRGRPQAAPASGRYTGPTPIERGTPIGRGRQLVCATKDQYKPFKFTAGR